MLKWIKSENFPNYSDYVEVPDQAGSMRKMDFRRTLVKGPSDSHAGGRLRRKTGKMINGLYHSAQGAEAQAMRLNVVSNNLANASTSSFKRDLAIFQTHRPFDLENGSGSEPPNQMNQHSGGLSTADVVTDFSNGPMLPTEGTYDIALAGPGFFRVSNGTDEFLTRDGRLAVNEEGELVTSDGGHHIQGLSGGPITIPGNTKEVQISSSGTVSAFVQAGGALIKTDLDQLEIVQPESLRNLKKAGNNLYEFEGDLQPADSSTQVRQGFLEGSGVKSVTEMLEMVEASRAFETNINMMKFQDEALGRLLQSAAK